MKQYKAAVIGLGNIGLLYDLEPQRPHPSAHVLTYEQSSSFQFVCGVDSDKTKKSLLEKIAPDARYFLSLKEAMDAELFCNVDVVSICTPPSTHMEILENLVECGIGRIIFCEKPIVSNIEEVGRLHNLMGKHKDTIIIPNISRRWNTGLRRVKDAVMSGDYGRLEKINIRYTRGIYNTGTHLFDLIRMWCNSPIKRVMALGKSQTSAEPEQSFSFYFELGDGVTGYAEAVDDRKYYLFDIDMYMSKGKIEMRNSGDDVKYYRVEKHHLFEGFNELILERQESNLLTDACLKNAVKNLEGVLKGKESAYCTVTDAVYPLYVAEALERSYRNGCMEEIQL